MSCFVLKTSFVINKSLLQIIAILRMPDLNIIKSKSNPRIHKTATKFPRKCDLCEMELESSMKMKIHIRKHSFKRIEYKWEDFDFCGDDELAMMVHKGRVYSVQFCGKRS